MTERMTDKEFEERAAAYEGDVAADALVEEAVRARAAEAAGLEREKALRDLLAKIDEEDAESIGIDAEVFTARAALARGGGDVSGTQTRGKIRALERHCDELRAVLTDERQRHAASLHRIGEERDHALAMHSRMADEKRDLEHRHAELVKAVRLHTDGHCGCGFHAECLVALGRLVPYSRRSPCI